jgi:hypothetical protein
MKEKVDKYISSFDSIVVAKNTFSRLRQVEKWGFLTNEQTFGLNKYK